ncbi:MAG: methyltransferase domain-containing protein [Rickettsia endosymbiont of Bryobia graminum]|nr:methyltransferase domain-containing protein [Rickettsia endosymbiont of Bryobia graminum]
MIIFDRKQLQFNRDKNIDNIRSCSYFQDSAEAIIQRLDLIDRNFTNILDIGCRTGQLTKLLREKYKSAIVTATNPSQSMLQFVEHAQKLLIDEEDLLFNEIQYDLISFSLGLHWINDIQRFLLNIKSILKPDGVFICNFIGGNSLKALRTRFIEAEIFANHFHSIHILPMINFDHITPLLSEAGFKEVIVDYDNIQFTHKSPFGFIKELKNIGETSILNRKSYYTISKLMLAALKDNTNVFNEQVSIISFIVSPNKNSLKLRI